MMQLRDTPEFKRGKEFERALAEWLRIRGFGFLGTHSYNARDNAAPLLRFRCDSVVLPDLFGVSRGGVFWIEAKRKRRASFTRITQSHDTGFSLRLYRQYREIKLRSGTPVYIAFGHEEENSVRAIEIDEIPPRIDTGTRMEHAGMAFWPWDALHELDSFEAMISLVRGPDLAWR